MTKHDIFNTILSFGRKPVSFEPVAELSEGDELTKAINEPIYHDNHWDLHEEVDGEALAKFWDEASKESSA